MPGVLPPLAGLALGRLDDSIWAEEVSIQAFLGCTHFQNCLISVMGKAAQAIGFLKWFFQSKSVVLSVLPRFSAVGPGSLIMVFKI